MTQKQIITEVHGTCMSCRILHIYENLPKCAIYYTCEQTVIGPPTLKLKKKYLSITVRLCIEFSFLTGPTDVDQYAYYCRGEWYSVFIFPLQVKVDRQGIRLVQRTVVCIQHGHCKPFTLASFYSDFETSDEYRKGSLTYHHKKWISHVQIPVLLGQAWRGSGQTGSLWIPDFYNRLHFRLSITLRPF